MKRLLIAGLLAVSGIASAGDWAETWTQQEFFVLQEGQPGICPLSLVVYPWVRGGKVEKIIVRVFNEIYTSRDELSFDNINIPKNSQYWCRVEETSTLEGSRLVYKWDYYSSNSHMLFPDTCKHYHSKVTKLIHHNPNRLEFYTYDSNEKPHERNCFYNLVPNPQK